MRNKGWNQLSKPQSQETKQITKALQNRRNEIIKIRAERNKIEKEMCDKKIP